MVVWGWGLGLGFLACGFQNTPLGPLGFWGLGSLFKRITLGKSGTS